MCLTRRYFFLKRQMQRGEHQAPTPQAPTLLAPTLFEESEESKDKGEGSPRPQSSLEESPRPRPSLEKLLADADEACPEFKSTRQFFGRLLLSFAKIAITRVENKLSEDVLITQSTSEKLALWKSFKSVLEEGQEEEG